MTARVTLKADENDIEREKSMEEIWGTRSKIRFIMEVIFAHPLHFPGLHDRRHGAGGLELHQSKQHELQPRRLPLVGTAASTSLKPCIPTATAPFGRNRSLYMAGTALRHMHLVVKP